MKQTKNLLFNLIALPCLFLIIGGQAAAQVKKDSSFQKKTRINAIIIADYATSLNKNVDIQSCVHNTQTDSGVVTNTFTDRKSVV